MIRGKYTGLEGEALCRAIIANLEQSLERLSRGYLENPFTESGRFLGPVAEAAHADVTAELDLFKRLLPGFRGKDNFIEVDEGDVRIVLCRQTISFAVFRPANEVRETTRLEVFLTSGEKIELEGANASLVYRTIANQGNV